MSDPRPFVPPEGHGSHHQCRVAEHIEEGGAVVDHEWQCSCGSRFYQRTAPGRPDVVLEDRSPSLLSGPEVDKDVGIASQHRARLKARIAGNVASGIIGHIPPAGHRGEEAPRARRIAKEAALVAEAILVECGQ